MHPGLALWVRVAGSKSEQGRVNSIFLMAIEILQSHLLSDTSYVSNTLGLVVLKVHDRRLAS